MNQQEKENIIKLLTVAFDVMGQSMSGDAIEMFMSRLLKYNFNQVQKSINKCVDECKYKITLAEIIERIDDGRPTADEAWQEVYMMCEYDSKVMTDEQSMAYCSVSTTMIGANTTDMINCKKAFVDKYNRLCNESKSNGMPVKYVLSRGTDPDGRLAALIEGVSQGKLTQGHAVKLLPEKRNEILNIPLLPEQKESALMIENMAKGISS